MYPPILIEAKIIIEILLVLKLSNLVEFCSVSPINESFWIFMKVLERLEFCENETEFWTWLA